MMPEMTLSSVVCRAGRPEQRIGAPCRQVMVTGFSAKLSCGASLPPVGVGEIDEVNAPCRSPSRGFYFDAFSSREPPRHFAENAMAGRRQTVGRIEDKKHRWDEHGVDVWPGSNSCTPLQAPQPVRSVAGQMHETLRTGDLGHRHRGMKAMAVGLAGWRASWCARKRPGKRRRQRRSKAEAGDAAPPEYCTEPFLFSMPTID